MLRDSNKIAGRQSQCLAYLQRTRLAFSSILRIKYTASCEESPNASFLGIFFHFDLNSNNSSHPLHKISPSAFHNPGCSMSLCRRQHFSKATVSSMQIVHLSFLSPYFETMFLSSRHLRFLFLRMLVWSSFGFHQRLSWVYGIATLLDLWHAQRETIEFDKQLNERKR